MKNEGYQLGDKVECEEGIYNQELSKKFDKLFHHVLQTTDRFFEQKNTVRVKVYGNVEIGTDISSEIIATFNDYDGIKVVPGQKIKAIKPYYRIGITHVSTE